MIGVQLENCEELDLDLDLPREVWDQIREVMEEHPHSQGITFILEMHTDKVIGRPRKLELERIIEKPLFPNLQTKWVWEL